ncbi:MAG: PIN domain-containing protein [Bradyrhizobiaceae bacterium]|nr:PIN domain-containing protein [Bradyrhizobiaceae bacterium]
MILVDTSIWVDHLRRIETTLVRLLEDGRVITHPFVIGELALGQLHQRDLILRTFHDLPKAIVADDREVLDFIDRERLFALDIGYIDAHLLASARLTPGASLWTRDKRLAKAAQQLSLAADPPT